MKFFIFFMFVFSSFSFSMKSSTLDDKNWRRGSSRVDNQGKSAAEQPQIAGITQRLNGLQQCFINDNEKLNAHTETINKQSERIEQLESQFQQLKAKFENADLLFFSQLSQAEEGDALTTQPVINHLEHLTVSTQSAKPSWQSELTRTKGELGQTLAREREKLTTAIHGFQMNVDKKFKKSYEIDVQDREDTLRICSQEIRKLESSLYTFNSVQMTENMNFERQIKQLSKGVATLNKTLLSKQNEEMDLIRQDVEAIKTQFEKCQAKFSKYETLPRRMEKIEKRMQKLMEITGEVPFIREKVYTIEKQQSQTVFGWVLSSLCMCIAKPDPKTKHQ